jgi:hypothetical protein
LVRTDRLGSVLWSRELSAIGSTLAGKVVPTVDGGFIFSGTWYFGYANLYEGEPLVVKTDSLGIEEWRLPAAVFQTHSIVQSIVQTDDGGYALVGDRVFDSVQQSFMLKLGADGRVLWGREWNSPDLFGSDIQQTPDGGYILGRDYDLGLIRIDAQGKELWRVGESGGILTTVLCTADGGYFGADCLLVIADIYNMYLAKWDSTGVRVWLRSYAAGGNYKVSAWLCHDGGFVICTQWHMARLDENGNEIWQIIQFNDEHYVEELSSVQETSDFGFILCDSNNHSPVLIKTDAAGKVW